MTERSEEITALNTLIATLIDSVEGYETSAEKVENPRFAEMFRARAQERRAAISALQNTVARLGGNPEDDGSTLGAAHRMFVGLKDAVLARDDTAIVNEVERGEDYLKEKFEVALQNLDLAPDVRASLDTAWSSVKAGHDEMSALKHQLT